MSIPVKDLLNWMERLRGLPYIFGTEQDGKSHPSAEDCSETIQNVCDMTSVIPKMPDGSANQLQHCRSHGCIISLDRAIKTPGALLFRISQKLGNHVAFSLGTGMTFEARGAAYGVGSWKAAGRPWTHGALIPGVSYEKEI